MQVCGVFFPSSMRFFGVMDHIHHENCMVVVMVMFCYQTLIKMFIASATVQANFETLPKHTLSTRSKHSETPVNTASGFTRLGNLIGFLGVSTYNKLAEFLYVCKSRHSHATIYSTCNPYSNTVTSTSFVKL